MVNNILLIEDSKTFRKIFCEHINQDLSDKYYVYESDCGSKGIQIMKDINIDCLILDYFLPDIPATDIIKEALYFDIPVVVISEYTREKAIVEVIKAGADDYICKKYINSGVIDNAISTAIKNKDLNHRKMKLNSIMDTVMEGIITIDDKGNILSSNQAIKDMLGYDEEEILGKNVRMLMTEEHSVDHDQYMSNYMNTGVKKIIGLHRELQAKHKNGKVIDIELGVSDINIGGKHIFVGALHDITERKKYELELIESRKAAEEANIAKTVFLANMSHEIRTPMNGIIGVIDLLHTCELNEEVKKYVDIVQSSSNLLYTIINDILDFSKLEAGEVEMERMPIVINALIDEVCIMLESQAAKNEIELIVKCDSDIPLSIYSDPSRLKQILINMVGNAIKFSYKKPIIIKVINKKINGNRATIRFEVEDRGIGIEKDKLDNIFERFSQADNSSSRKYGGTGLGLSISKRIIELMGGTIGVESEFGKGSAFWIEAEFDVYIAGNYKVDYTNKSEYLRGKNILIACEYDASLNIVSEYLNESGLDSHLLCSLDTIMHNIEEYNINGKPFDIVIVDYNMFNNSGETIGRMIKSDINKFGDPILILLAPANIEEEIIDLDHKIFSSYITKPVYSHTLIDAMYNAMSDKDKNTENNVIDFIEDTHESLPGKVLLVEDSINNRIVQVDMLEKIGCDVDLVFDGEEAVKILQDNNDKYDVVFMDCQMPNKDGFEATREIRNSEWGKDIVIIAITSNAFESDRQKCLDAGMDDYLSKPVRMQDMYNILYAYIIKKDIKNREDIA